MYPKQKYLIIVFQFGQMLSSKKLIIDKKCAHKKFKLSHSHQDYLIFSNLRKKCKQLISFCHAQNITNLENSILTSIKPFWKYIKPMKKTNNVVPDCENYHNHSSSNTSETV